MNERKIDTLKAAIRTTIEESNCIYGDIIKALGQLLFLNKNIGNLVVTKESGYFIRAVL